MGLLLLLSLAALATARPIYAWSQKRVEGLPASIETTDLSPSNALANSLGELFEADRAFSAILYVRPGLTTEQLAANLQSKYPTLQAILRKGKRNHYQRSFLDSEVGATRAV